MRTYRDSENRASEGGRRAAPACCGNQGYALLEALVYIGLVMMLLGVGYAALYRCIDNSVALRRSADDIASALHVGERWRADVRAASGEVRLENGPGEQTLVLAGPRGGVAYRCSDGALFRRLGEGQWVQLLGNVRASTMAADPRHDLVAWRWELELMPQSKASVKASRIRPLFTFLAVPAKGSTSASTLSDGGLQPAGELANSLSTAPVVNH